MALVQPLEKMAEFSIARACGFALLAILTTMIGLSNEPRLMLTVGGVLALMAAMTLVLKGLLAEHKNYRKTELWLLLHPDERPPESVAQRVIASVLREAYFRFALYFSYGSGALLTAVAVLALFTGASHT